MSCVAITRGGFGSIYLFESRQEAEIHPIIQYGDAFLCGSKDIVNQYNSLEIGKLMSMLDDEPLRVSVLRPIHPDLNLSHIEKRKRIIERSEEIWDAILQLAVSPPSDPVEVLQVIVKDRKHFMENDMSDEVVGTEEKVKKSPKAKRYNNADVVRLLSDADGKQYGADHNPKRTGSASYLRFANYVDGITVGELIQKGNSQAVVFGDLDYDTAKGYIEVERAIVSDDEESVN